MRQDTCTARGGTSLKGPIELALDKLVHGVYVICVRVADKSNGMTAAWVTQVSGHPPMVLVAVGKNHLTSSLISEAGAFSVNMLSSQHRSLACLCGSVSGRDRDKLLGVPVKYGVTGMPILVDSVGYLDCTLVESLEVGDHVLFVGEVVDGDASEGDVLVYRSADYT